MNGGWAFHIIIIIIVVECLDYIVVIVSACQDCIRFYCARVLRTIQRTILQTIGVIIRLVRHVFVSHNNKIYICECALSGGVVGVVETGHSEVY